VLPTKLHVVVTAPLSVTDPSRFARRGSHTTAFGPALTTGNGSAPGAPVPVSIVSFGRFAAVPFSRELKSKPLVFVLPAIMIP
jgi:hypothetical protein